MNSFKRIISMLLAVAMIFSMSAIVAYADDTTTTSQEAADAVLTSAAASAIASLPNDDVQYADAYKFDYALGIFEMLSDGYWQKEAVTRGEFSTIVAKMIKANTEGYPSYSYSPYSDISAEHFAYPAVCYLSDIGILNGDGNSTFRPDDPILVNEATKMVMCAIGFKEACEVNGGFPNGYTQFAVTQGIYNNLNFSYTSTMTAMQMSQMVRNALEAYIMEKVIYRADGTADAMLSDSKTLLTETYKMENVIGTVEGTYLSYVSGSEVGLDNEVVIDGVCYQYDTKTDLEQYIGYEVNLYYMDDVSGYRRPYIVYCEPRNGKNTETNIKAEDIVSISDTAIVYSDKNGNEKTISINSDADISYNGKPFFDLNDEFSIKEGNIKVISHSSASRADVVLIQEQFDGLFDRYNKTTYQVVFQDNATQKLPEMKFDTVYRTKLTLDGQEIKPEELLKNDAISYTVSKDGEYIRGYVSRNVIQDGEVSRISTEQYPAGTYTLVRIGDTDYIVSPYCAKEITAGLQSDFQITYDGRIIGAKAAGSSGGNYGYLIKFGTDGGAFNTSFRVKILDKNGKISEYESASKVNTNIGSEVEQLSASKIAEAADRFEEPQLVVFEVDSNNKIRTLYKAKDNTEELGDPDDLDFGKYFDGTATYSNSLIGTCAINDSTIIFSVPYVDRDRDDDYSVLQKSDMSNGSYTTEIYDIRNGVANCVVVKEKEPSKVSDTAKTLVIDEFSISWDAEKMERVKTISGWNKGEYVSYMIDDEVISRAESYTTNKQNVLDDGIVNGTAVKIGDLKRGDVIQYELGSNGYISRFRVLNNYNMRKYVADPESKYFEINQDGQESYKLSSGDECYLTFGQIIRVHDYYFVETSNLNDKKYFRAYPTTDVNLYIYDTVKDEIRVGDPFDIEQGNDVFIRTKNLNQEIDIVVYQ